MKCTCNKKGCKQEIWTDVGSDAIWFRNKFGEESLIYATDVKSLEHLISELEEIKISLIIKSKLEDIEDRVDKIERNYVREWREDD